VVFLLAGRYSRHCELAADRLAADLTEDPAAMRDALSRLADVTKTPADRRSPTHPSLTDRLDALGVRTG
jgi:Zn-dependent protease with chaperone function